MPSKNSTGGDALTASQAVSKLQKTLKLPGRPTAGASCLGLIRVSYQRGSALLEGYTQVLQHEVCLLTVLAAMYVDIGHDELNTPV